VPAAQLGNDTKPCESGHFLLKSLLLLIKIQEFRGKRNFPFFLAQVTQYQAFGILTSSKLSVRGKTSQFRTAIQGVWRMSTLRRMQVVGAALTLTVILSHSQLWGDNKARDNGLGGSRTVPAKAERPAPLGEDLERTKFARPGVVNYTTLDGTQVFGMPIKLKLDAGEKGGADILVLVDTSASQVGMPLRLAAEITELISKQAGPKDRIALWTVNTPAATHKHLATFKAAKGAHFDAALKALRNELPLGNTDLHNGLTQALELFKNSDNPTKAIVFLGDGYSTYNPISSADRAALCEKLVKEQVRFYPVPLGPMLDYQNIQGFTSGTGGQVIRLTPSEKTAALVTRLETAIQAPVLYPTEFKITGAKEVFPAKLPPLRGDSATLVVGKFEGAKELAYEIAGTVNGKKVTVKGAETVLDAEPDNFFLVTMVDQWKKAPDEPAMMRADRALAFAQQINFVARDELLGQAQMALMLDERPAARKLFEQAKKLDPNDAEAKGGLALIDALDQGKVNREDLRKQLAKKDGKGLMIEKVGEGKKGKVEFRRDEMRNLVALADKAEKGPAIEPAPVAPAAREDNLERQQLQKQAVEEQRIGHVVDEALRQARRLVQTDPDAAVDLLKRALAGIRDNNDLRPQFRQGLIGRLEPALRNVTTDAIKAKQDMEERLVILAQAEDRFIRESQLLQDQERTRERMRRYRNLMNQARYEDAFQEGLALMQDSVNQGRPVSPAATAATDIGLLSYHLKEEQELKRVRQERFLATMLQVERSHIPFPDEPPIQFPPTATWKQLTQLRKDKYESSGLTDDDPQTLKKLKELKGKMESSVTLDGFDANTPLKEALGFISERYGITILMDVEAFKENGIMEPENQPVKLPKMVNVRLDTVLRLLLAQASATFILRRDYIEVTTPQRQAAEKTLRVYPVADLVTPIPNSVNQSAVNQTQANSLLGIQGGFAGVAGMMMGGFNMGMGGFNMAMGMGGFNMAMGMGGFNMAMGGMGGFNMGMAMGMGGMQMGMMMGMGGFGGGFGGAGYAQGGAGGNLGGQFGLQGGDTSQLLIRLITQVVGKPEDWMPLQQMMGGQPGFPGAGAQGFGFGMMGMFGGMMMGIPPADPNEGYGNPNEAGALGYYSPTRALIVKATSRVHTRLGGGLLAPRPPAGGAGAGALLIEPGKKPVQVAGAGDKKDPKKPTPAEVKKPTEPVVKVDAKKDWQDALAKGRYEPGLIIATADFLVAQGQFTHAAEFLKADLRTATVVRPWVYEALSLSLRLSKGSVEEIERAELSAIDVMPSDSQGYLKAGQAMADAKQWGRAVAFCKQASLLTPDSPEPYANALRYAREAKDVDAMDWASSNLLKNDWPTQNKQYHGKAQDELKHLKELLQKEKDTDPAKLARLDSAKKNLQRDLVITLDWKGQADLDLEITEPIGTVCSFQQRQTPGGGTLLGDALLEPNRETYVASEAFSGDYQVKIKRMWGRPQGSSAILQVVEHQGTADERIIFRQAIVADFEKTSPTKTITLKVGRRTSVASVSPTPMLSAPDDRKEKIEGGDQVLNKLRALSDPDLMGTGGGVRGGFGDLPPITAKMPPGRAAAVPTGTYQGKAASVVDSGVEMTYKPVVSSDRQVVGMQLNPVFKTLGTRPAVGVLNPAIPGGK
jgi:hypothetical protein